MKDLLKLFLLGILVISNTQCNNDAKIEALRVERQTLHCEMEMLKHQSDSLWNAVAVHLDQELPPDMKPDERRNMINIKNAGLIRMFEVFPSLDSSIHSLVEHAEKMDQALASQMRANMEANHVNEAALNQVLENLEKGNPDKFKKLKQDLEADMRTPCPN